MIGKVVKINKKFELQNQTYFSFIFSDDHDKLKIAIIDTPETLTKINFILNQFHSNKIILIKEPRRPNDGLSKHGIDLEISKEEPPIGTDLRLYDENFENLKIKNEITKDIQTREKLKLKDLSFTSASELLEKKTNFVLDINKSSKFNNFKDFHKFLKDNLENGLTITYFNIEEIQKINFTRFFYVISCKNLNKLNFTSNFKIYGGLNSQNKSIKILDFEIKNKDHYDPIKNNLNLIKSFNNIKDIINLGT